MYTRNSKCIVIAGGPWQKPLVEFLKRKGEFVYVVNPKKTETTKMADGHIVADVNDFDLINSYALKIKPSFITSDQSDVSTMTVAKISSYWNLPGNNPEVVELFTNKYKTFQFAKSIGIPVPLTTLKKEELSDFPLVVKPVDATNSRGFRKVDHKKDLEEAYQSSKKFSNSGQVIFQEYLFGKTQITLDGVCSGGFHKTLATSKKGEYFKPGLTSSVRYPSNISPRLLNQIISDNDKYVEMSGLNFGLTHGEYIVDEEKEEYHLVEIAARGAGAGITDKITPWVSGIDPYEIIYSSLKGEKVDVKSLIPLNRPAILQFYHENEMKNFSILNLDEIKKNKGVAAFYFDFRSEQFSIDEYNPRHTMGIYRAESEKELDLIIEKISNLCKV